MIKGSTRVAHDLDVEVIERRLRALEALSAETGLFLIDQLRGAQERLDYALGSLRVIAAPECDGKSARAFARAGLDLAERGPIECAAMRGDGDYPAQRYDDGLRDAADVAESLAGATDDPFFVAEQIRARLKPKSTS